MPDIKLLDCTLRDGGYVNSWNWGFAAAKDIIASLTRAGTDIVEVGFLRNVDGYNPDVTVCNTIEELNRLLPAHTGSTMYSGMAMRSNYDIAKLSPYEGHGIEMLRITAHDYDIREGMDFAREVKARGYKLSINPINIMGYADKDLLWILDQVNEIHPYQFSIVDTFGSMRRRDLERIVSLVDHNLAPDIRVGLHLHENMALSFCLAQEFLDKHLGRDTTVDGSLMGMGRIPGNLPIELIADYMNETLGCHYDIDEMMDAIQDHIAPLKGETAWGYTPAYFLSARYNLHRDYAEHYLDKGDLTNRDINHILAGFDRSKATAYDKDYADRLYREYQNRAIDDTAALDTRIKATVTSTMYDMSRVNANGYFDAENSSDARYAKRQALNEQRTEDYKAGTYKLGGGVADPLPADAPFFVKDYYDYYKTKRGYHPRSLNSNGGWNVTGTMSFLNQPILAYSNEIRSAVLIIHGEKAHSVYFSKDAYKNMIDGNPYTENKELLIIPGAVHTDLYDGGGKNAIPFDKIENFFDEYLK